jgi:hypothetical protein
MPSESFKFFVRGKDDPANIVNAEREEYLRQDEQIRERIRGQVTEEEIAARLRFFTNPDIPASAELAPFSAAEQREFIIQDLVLDKIVTQTSDYVGENNRP